MHIQWARKRAKQLLFALALTTIGAQSSIVLADESIRSGEKQGRVITYKEITRGYHGSIHVQNKGIFLHANRGVVIPRGSVIILDKSQLTWIARDKQSSGKDKVVYELVTENGNAHDLPGRGKVISPGKFTILPLDQEYQTKQSTGKLPWLVTDGSYVWVLNGDGTRNWLEVVSAGCKDRAQFMPRREIDQIPKRHGGTGPYHLSQKDTEQACSGKSKPPGVGVVQWMKNHSGYAYINSDGSRSGLWSFPEDCRAQAKWVNASTYPPRHGGKKDGGYWIRESQDIARICSAAANGQHAGKSGSGVLSNTRSDASQTGAAGRIFGYKELSQSDGRKGVWLSADKQADMRVGSMIRLNKYPKITWSVMEKKPRLDKISYKLATEGGSEHHLPNGGDIRSKGTFVILRQ